MITQDGHTVPMVLAIGNHEVEGGYDGTPAEAPFYFGYFAQQPNRSYFSRQFGANTALFVLDSGHAAPHGGQQAAWLEDEMAANANVFNKMALYHVPLYPGHVDFDDEHSSDGRTHWLPIFDGNGLTVAFENHNHVMKRSKLLKANQVDATGTLYIGDGCFGISPKSGAQAGAFYLERVEGIRHFWRVDIPAASDNAGSAMSFSAIDRDGEIFDFYSLQDVSVYITGPANGATFNDGELITITADASASQGTVTLVEFFEGNIKLGESDSEPFELVWSDALPGNYALTAVATNDAGESATSSVISISILPPGGPVTLDFQNGVLPMSTYTGGRDTYLDQNDPTVNRGFENELSVDGDGPRGSGFDQSALLSWDISAIPAGAAVLSASLALNISNKTRHSYEFYAMKRIWNEHGATWNTFDGSTSWAAPGAQATEDRGSEVLALFPNNVTGAVTIDFNADGLAVVQSWVDNPAGNFGFILANESSTDGSDFFSGEAPSVGDRPRLSVTYIEPQDAGVLTLNAEPLSKERKATIRAKVVRMGERSLSLRWSGGIKGRISPFIIEQAIGDAPFREIAEVWATSGVTSNFKYRFDHLALGNHIFRLKQSASDGSSIYSNDVEITIEPAGDFELSNAYPNPFNASTRFTLAVSMEQNVRVEIFNTLGQRVDVLFDGRLQENAVRTYRFDAAGLPSGIYFYRVRGERFVATRRLLFLK